MCPQPTNISRNSFLPCWCSAELDCSFLHILLGWTDEACALLGWHQWPVEKMIFNPIIKSPLYVSPETPKTSGIIEIHPPSKQKAGLKTLSHSFILYPMLQYRAKTTAPLHKYSSTALYSIISLSSTKKHQCELYKAHFINMKYFISPEINIWSSLWCSDSEILLSYEGMIYFNLIWSSVMIFFSVSCCLITPQRTDPQPQGHE